MASQSGQVYLALALWRRLGLHQFFEENIRAGREQIDWATIACILSIGRLCSQSSELALSEHWYAKTALDDLLGVNAVDVYENRLYRGLDELLPLLDELFAHLRERYRSMFGSRFESLLYDITSTYFEGQCERNPQAQRGYSALVMWRTLEMWLKGKGFGDCARQVLKELGSIHSMDVVLQVKDKADLRLRLVGKPDKMTADLLAHMQLKLPTRPKRIQNVVETQTP